MSILEIGEADLIKLRKEAIAKALERIETVDPMLNVIITGHLLIEEEINKLIKTLVWFPGEAEKLIKRNINFPARVSLTRAFTPFDLGESFWSLILGFNQFRNDFAHNHGERQAENLLQIRAILLFSVAS
jgi:hypothetical protein